MCASVLSVTTGPFIKVLALHLPWSLDCMLAAPGKTYITVCLPLLPHPPQPLFYFSPPISAPFAVSAINIKRLNGHGLSYILLFLTLSFVIFLFVSF